MNVVHRNWHWLGIALLAAGIVLEQGPALAQEIHLKTRDVNTRFAANARPSRVRLPNAGPVHQIVQFDHPPGVEDLEALMASGYQVVAMVPDNAVTVIAPERITSRLPGVNWIGDLEPGDKLSPALGTAGPIQAIVEFHADVEAAAQQSVATAEGVTLVRPAALLANHAIATASPEKLRALAGHDEVAYIFPADPALSTGSELMPCAGMLTLAGPIGQYANIVHGWDLDSGSTAHLGYIFGTLTAKVPAATVQSEVIRALNAWSSITNVVFSPAVSATAVRTILVEFATGAHGDAYPFDGAGQILAHTFYPVPLNPESLAGDVHLNSSVNWHAGSDIDIYSVALHEIGHALGLGHSDNPGDVMYPYYRRGMQLSANDIGAVRALYGSPGATPAAPVTTTSAPTATPLSLTLNPIVPPGQAAAVSIAGTVSGGTPPVNVSWQSDQGYSGNVTAGSAGTWSATGISLVTGANTVTVTAFDSAKKTASQSAVVTRVAAAAPVGSRPVSISITSPASAVVTASSATISIGGTASGGCGVTRVTWQTSGGASGTAAGAGPWLAPGIPLLTGTNTIIVRAYDNDGETGWASLVVVRN